MKTLTGLDLNDAAKGLHVRPCRLRQHLANLGAIRKTEFGWVACPQFRERGLLTTSTRQTTITTEVGHRIRRHYTVVVITGDGLAWLQQQLTPANSERTH